MKINKTTRIIIIIFLILMGLLSAYVLLFYLSVVISGARSVITLPKGVYGLAIMGTLALFTFLVVVLQDLLKNRLISKMAYGLSIALSVVAGVSVALLVLGSWWFMFVLNPIAIVVTGLIAAYGTYKQLTLRKNLSS